jgi:type III restriction enzyme
LPPLASPEMPPMPMVAAAAPKEPVVGRVGNNWRIVYRGRAWTVPGDTAEEKFRYEGFDLITLQKEIEREYTIAEPQTPQEVIGYYARRVAQEVKLPSQFAALVPKVREFFENKAFGKKVDLDSPVAVRAMSTNVAHYVCVQGFKKALLALIIEPQEAQLLEPERKLSSTQPFPWSRPVWEGQKCILNLVPCENSLERAFAKFLDGASDVVAFCKIPEVFGFAIEYTDPNVNLRYYYPDFVALDENGTRWLLETKGAETAEVEHKDHAARRWCEDATKLTATVWRYLKIPQKEFDQLQPVKLADLTVLEGSGLFTD